MLVFFVGLVVEMCIGLGAAGVGGAGLGGGRTQQFGHLARLVIVFLPLSGEYFRDVVRKPLIFFSFIRRGCFLDLQDVSLNYLFDMTGPVSVCVKMRRWVVCEGDMVEQKPEWQQSAW